MPDLTSKELTGLEEQLKHEGVLVAKYKQMANECTDPILANTLQDISNKHQGHYNTLFQFLN